MKTKTTYRKLADDGRGNEYSYELWVVSGTDRVANVDCTPMGRFVNDDVAGWNYARTDPVMTDSEMAELQMKMTGTSWRREQQGDQKTARSGSRSRAVDRKSRTGRS